jgi:hypothetical protein
MKWLASITLAAALFLFLFAVSIDAYPDAGHLGCEAMVVGSRYMAGSVAQLSIAARNVKSILTTSSTLMKHWAISSPSSNIKN